MRSFLAPRVLSIVFALFTSVTFQGCSKMILLCNLELYLCLFVFQKLRIWCRLRNGQWVSGQIQSSSGEKATVLLSDHSVSSRIPVIS